jgi:hypothetical protein
MSGKMLSDQLYYWSDVREQERILLAKEAPTTRFTSYTVRSRTPWLSHREIQTLRKTGLPLFTWTRTWTKVLSVDQSIGNTTRDALRSPTLSGESPALPGRLSETTGDPERDNEYQPRALETARAFLERRHVAYGRHARCNDHRLRRGRGFAGKHARGGVAERQRRECESGGAP